MIKQFRNSVDNARFYISIGFPLEFSGKDSFLYFFWNDTGKGVQLSVDDRIVNIESGQIICLTYLQQIKVIDTEVGFKCLAFNREFYCVHTNDAEVSCNGLLFFGSDYTPIVTLDEAEIKRLSTLFSVLEEEFLESDSNQEEMLRILLKRFIIRCTRLAKKQLLKETAIQSDIDIIRKFNYLVEEHFRAKKTVSEYAALLYKSPKTINNIFSKYASETPLQIIHNRLIIEAKRMLLYTDKSAKEIGFDLGYHDPAQFSKLFKNNTGLTTSEFKGTGIAHK
jgi:AraC-like DNA-binding protein